MSLSSRKKAAIKRASKKARQRLRAIDADTQKSLRGAFERTRDDVQASIMEAADNQNLVRLESLQALMGRVDRRLAVLSGDKRGLLDEGLAAAASNGASPFAGLSMNLTDISDDAVAYVNRFVAEDGLQLSDRLWRNDRQARELIGRRIESAVIQGNSASEAASDLLSRGEPVPAELLKNQQKANAEKIASAAVNELEREGGVYYNAERLFRTEINRAHGEAYRTAAEETPGAIGTRFLLSPRHPRPDICDMHASVNRYGLGPGVYPFGKSPWPAHPNTLSFEEVVFDDEVPEDEKNDKEDRIEWLKKQPPGVQEQVLGSRKKREALQAGVLKESQINTPWRVLKERYQRQGLDVDNLVPAGASATTGSLSAAGKAVSQAIKVEGYQSVAEETLRAIDQVHGDGVLPEIPVKRSRARKYRGVFIHIPATGRPVEIRVSAYGDAKEITLAHEIGHFIDNQAFQAKVGLGRFASVDDPVFKKWRDAVEDSAATKGLRELLIHPELQGRRWKDLRKHVRYLLSTHEQWARAYSQYIARKSSSQKMKDQITRMVARQNQSPLWVPAQWDDDDFEPISSAIDEIMLELGWQK